MPYDPEAKIHIDQLIDTVKKLFKINVILAFGLLAFFILTFGLVMTTTSKEHCTEWTIDVRDATKDACCKGEIECPTHLTP